MALSVKNAKRIEIKQVDTGHKKIECLTPLNVDKLLYIHMYIDVFLQQHKKKECSTMWSSSINR